MQLFRKRTRLEIQKNTEKPGFAGSFLWLVFGILLTITGFACLLARGLKQTPVRMSVSERETPEEVQRQPAGLIENTPEMVIEELDLEEQLQLNPSGLQIEQVETRNTRE